MGNLVYKRLTKMRLFVLVRGLDKRKKNFYPKATIIVNNAK